jgi:hypothetical protein
MAATPLDDLQFGLPTNSPGTILNDNNGRITLSKNTGYIFLLYFIFPISITLITVRLTRLTAVLRNLANDALACRRFAFLR